MCVIIDLVLVLTPMPMPYHIFPNAFPDLKDQKRRRLVCGGVSPPPPPPLPSTALLRCTASCALGRGPVCEGVATGWRASHCRWPLDCLCLPPLLFPQPTTGRQGLCGCVYGRYYYGRQGFNAGVPSPSAPGSCCSGSSPEFRVHMQRPLCPERLVLGAWCLMLGAWCCTRGSRGERQGAPSTPSDHPGRRRSCSCSPGRCYNPRCNPPARLEAWKAG
jgi:hypothetical protein